MNDQGGDWSCANHALPGSTATMIANNIAFDQAVPGSTAAWAEIACGADYHVLACGTNDALLLIDNPPRTPAQQQQAVNYLINGCLRKQAPGFPPVKPIIFVAMQFVPPGISTNFDSFLAYASGLADYVVNIPYYQLREMGLLMNDSAVFNQPAPAIQIVGGYHPKAIANRFIGREFVKQMAAKLPAVFQFQPSTYPPWDDWAAAYSEFQKNSAIWQALQSNWS
jgi:hypothetical protein